MLIVLDLIWIKASQHCLNWRGPESLPGSYAGSDPEEFIKRFGLDDDYVRRFLEAYPQYRTTISTD